MIEILKELAQVFKDLPNAAIWVAGGILFYKLTIVGSVFGIIKLAINKVHDILTREKVVTTRVDLEGHFITHDGTYRRFVDFLRVFKKERSTEDYQKLYLHDHDVEFIINAVNEALDKKKKQENK